MALPPMNLVVRVMAWGAVCGLIALLLAALIWVFDKPRLSAGETPKDASERILLRLVEVLLLLVVGLAIPIWCVPQRADKSPRPDRDTSRAKFEVNLGETLHVDTGVDISQPPTQSDSRAVQAEFAVSVGTADLPRVAASVGRERGSPRSHYPYLLLPAFAFLGALLAAWFFYIFVALAATKAWSRRFRTMVGAVQGFCLSMVLLSVGIVVLIFSIWWLGTDSEAPQLLPAMGTILSLIFARLLAKDETDLASAKTWLEKVTAIAPQVGVTLAVVVLVVCVLIIGLQLAVPYGDDLAWILKLGGVGAGALLALGIFVDFNRISPHYFYRDRLVETYLQTETGTRELKEARNDEPLELRELHERYIDNECRGNAAPYHLILCALNLPGSRDLARRNRKSDHFIFSRDFTGSATTGYVRTEYYRRGDTKFASAITISGAAIASTTGYATSLARSFAATLFNIRLGQWLVNPRVYDEEERDGEPIIFYPESAGPTLSWYRTGWFGGIWRHALGRFVKLSKGRFIFWPAYLFYEMTTMTNARGALVNLSDGGHTGDNVGLYPLLQRRCKLIIACDAECDPKYTFQSLTSAITQIYTDENVKVSIDLDRIRPKPDGTHPQGHYVIGRIEYPACKSSTTGNPNDGSDAPEAKYQVGWLIYLKSSFLGRDEPVAVTSYAAQHADFPQQSTTDQFFDDDQFEAYRSLGVHIARTMLSAAGLLSDETRSQPAPTDVDHLIRFCKKRWEPTKAQIEEALQECGQMKPIPEERVKKTAEAIARKFYLDSKDQKVSDEDRDRVMRLLEDYRAAETSQPADESAST
jgi:hypothetical protein